MAECQTPAKEKQGKSINMEKVLAVYCQQNGYEILKVFSNFIDVKDTSSWPNLEKVNLIDLHFL